MVRRPTRRDKLLKYPAAANIVVSGQIEVNSKVFRFIGSADNSQSVRKQPPAIPCSQDLPANTDS
jgi:hypothetical protein